MKYLVVTAVVVGAIASCVALAITKKTHNRLNEACEKINKEK